MRTKSDKFLPINWTNINILGSRFLIHPRARLLKPGPVCLVVRAQRKGSDEVKEFGWHVRFKFSVAQLQLNSTAGLVMPIKHPYRGKFISPG